MIGATTRGPYASVMARVRTAAMMDDSGHQLVFEGRAGWAEGRGGLHEFAKVQHRRDEHRARVFEPMIVETGTKGEKKLQVKKKKKKSGEQFSLLQDHGSELQPDILTFYILKVH